MPLLVWVMTSLATTTSQRLHGHAPLDGQLLARGQVLQRIHGGVDHVEGVVGPQRLGEDVVHAHALQHRAHRAAGDDAGTRVGRAQQHPSRAVLADDVVRDGAVLHGHPHHGAAGRVDGLAHRLGHLVRLAGAHAHLTRLVAHGHQRGEGEPPAALHHLGHAVDVHHVLLQVAPLALVAATAAAPLAATAAPAPLAVAAALGPALAAAALAARAAAEAP